MRQPDSKFHSIQYTPTDLLACTHTFGKVGVQKKFFACSARESCFVPPHFKIRGAAPGFAASEVMTYIGLEILLFIDQFIASLDQGLQAYKLLAGQFGYFWLLVNIISRTANDSCQDTR